MSLKTNILSNYLSQFYIAAIGIAVVPMQIKYIGVESFGVVAFFSMLQAWFQLLDLGLTLTMVRASARYRKGAMKIKDFRSLLCSMEYFFIFIAVFGFFVIYFLSGLIASKWFILGELTVKEVENSLILIGVAVSLRWVSGLYRGIINGFECLVWLGGFNVLVATFRFVGVLPYLYFVSSGLESFFYYQIVVCAAELFVLTIKCKSLIPGDSFSTEKSPIFSPLLDALRFSLSVAFTTLTWIFVSQSDKLLLSKILPLIDYGKFSLVVMLANGLLILSGPLNGALMPRMTALSEDRNRDAMVQIYNNATQFLCSMVFPAALLLVVFSKDILYVWTNDLVLSENLFPILSFYSAGNLLLIISGFPYQLQFAKGDLRLHVRGSFLFVIFMLPLMLYFARKYGALGASVVWFCVNLGYFLIWPSLVHRRFLNKSHFSWLKNNVLSIFFPVAMMGGLARFYLEFQFDRMMCSLQILVTGIFLTLVSVFSSRFLRESLKNKLK